MNGAVLPTCSAGDSSVVSDGAPKSMPNQARLKGVTSTRDQISSALSPAAVHGVVGVSTVSTFDTFRASSTLIQALNGRDTSGSQASPFETLAVTCSMPMPLKFR